MLVILNSDVLYTNGFVHRSLHKQWQQFADGCRSVNAELVFPSTALYEIELRQSELYQSELQAIGTARDLLERYGIGFRTRPIPNELIKVPDIVRLFGEAGVRTRVEKATLEDFRDAERRAAMHLAPAPPRKPPTGKQDTDDSDEMRDLVIWAIACRLAATYGGALLLSRDKVHSGPLGRGEAEEKRLLRASDFDEALGMLGAETEAGKIASSFLRAAWTKLRENGLPLREQFAVKTITQPMFIQGEKGIESASFAFSSETNNDKRLSGRATVSEVKDAGFRLRLSDLLIDNSGQQAIDTQVTHQVEGAADDLEERLSALREILR
jgi:hypothetical protein